MSIEITAEDGSKIVTDLPAEAVAELQGQKPEEKPAPVPAEKPQEAEPAKPADEPKPKADEPKPAEPKPEEPAKPEPQARDDKGQFTKQPKASPIQKLLDERHTLREENTRLKADLEKAANNKPADAPVSDADVSKIMEKYNVDEANRGFITELVSAIRAGMKAPDELGELLEQHQQSKLLAQEQQGFENDYARLQNSLPDDALKNPDVKDKLLNLAYSEDKAPDGEPYFQKPLFELYMKYVKPEVEPPTPSAEPTRGGSQATGKVIDYADIKADPVKLEEFARTATSEEFAKFQKWDQESSGDVPMHR